MNVSEAVCVHLRWSVVQAGAGNTVLFATGCCWLLSGGTQAQVNTQGICFLREKSSLKLRWKESLRARVTKLGVSGTAMNTSHVLISSADLFIHAALLQ